MAQLIEFVGTGGTMEGNFNDVPIDVNLDSVLTLDGSADYLTATSADFRSSDSAGSITGWFKTAASGIQTIFSASDTGTTSYSLRVYLDEYLYVVHKDSSTIYDVRNSRQFEDGSWHHFAIVSSGSSISIYVDGVAETIVVNSGSNNGDWFGDMTASKLDNVTIGAITHTSTTDYFNGSLADVRYYSAALTAADAGILASKIQVDDALTSIQAVHHWKLNSDTISSSGVGDDTGSATAIDLTPTSIVAGSFDYDAFSVAVQDNSTTTDGTFTVTQGKLENLSLSYPDFDGSADYITCGDTDFTADWTVACWVRSDDGTPADEMGIVAKRSSATDANFMFYVDKVSPYNVKSYDGTVRDHGFALTTSEWTHLAFVFQDSDNTLKSFKNGVLQGTVTFNPVQGNTVVVIGEGGKSQYSSAQEYWTGGIRDVRLYDYQLSDDQAASLYSGTYLTDPKHWYKIDEGSGATASIEDYGTGTDADGTGVSLTWTNGTLDLDSTLTIAANGTLSAPRGTLDLAGNYTQSGGTFTHNSGTVLFSGSGVSGDVTATTDATYTNTTFYNYTSSPTAGTHEFLANVNVEGTLTHTANNFEVKGSGTTLTVGTTTASGTINVTGGGFRPAQGGPTTIQAKAQLYPISVTGNDWDWDGGGTETLNLKWVDFDPDVTTGGGGITITLTGDCEFDAVTVSSGDTLDCQTYDFTTSGTLTVEGTFTGGSGLHNINAIDANNATGSLTLTSGITYLNGGGSGCLGLSSSLPSLSFANGTLVFNQSDGNQRFEFNKLPTNDAARMGRVMFNNGSSNYTYIGALGWSASHRIPKDDIIFASSDSSNGFLTQNLDMSTDGNMTIATGAKVNAGSSDLTVAGDFTTSGGLIGKSALVFDGGTDDEYVSCGSDSSIDNIFNSGGGGTIEAWINTNSDGEGNAGTILGKQWNLTTRNESGGKCKLHWLVGAGTTNGEWTTTNTVITNGKWHHVAVTYDRTGGDGSGHNNVPTIYVDGKSVPITTTNQPAGSIGNDSTSTLRISSTSANFDGEIAMVRMFSDIRTEAELRADMFNAHANMANTGNLVAMYQFDEGTGTTVDNIQGTAAADGTITGAAWAGAGTFTEGSSTLVFTGTSTWTMGSYLGVGTQINNMTVNAPLTLKSIDNGYGAVYMTTAGTFTLGASGTVTSTDAETLYFSTAGSTIDVSANTDGLSALEALRFRHSSGNINLPELTTKSVKCEVSGGTVTSTGDNTITTELEVASGTTFDANGNTVTSALVDMNGGTLDMQTAKSTLDFSSTSGFPNDSTGTLTLGAAALTKEGIGALEFDGTTSSATETGAADSRLHATNNSTGFTAAAWIYPKSDGEGDGGRIFDDVQSGNGWQMNMTGESGGTVKIEANINHATTDSYVVTSTTMTTNAWHHVALVYNDDSDKKTKIYIDGALASLTTDQTGAGAVGDDTDNKLYVGNNSAGTRTFDGYISGVRYYRGALTLGQLRKIYNSGNGHTLDVVDDSLVLWLRGDDGSGTTWTDMEQDINFTLTSTNWTNATITSTASDNYNFTMTTGTMAITSNAALIEDCSAFNVNANQAMTFDDTKFNNYGGVNFVSTADLAAGTMATFTRCEFTNPSEATRLIEQGVDSNLEDAFLQFIDCNFIRPNTATPISLGRGRLMMSNCLFTHGTGTWANPSGGQGKGWSTDDITVTDPEFSDIVSRLHDRTMDTFISCRMSNDTPATTTFTAANSTLYSSIPTQYQPTRNDQVGLDDSLTSESGYSHIFAMDRTNQLFGSLNVDNLVFVKMQQESSADITLYVGSLAGTGTILTDEGRVYDDATSAFEFGHVHDTLNKMGNDLDGDMSGAVNNLIRAVATP